MTNKSFALEYNTDRDHLAISEYGRNVQRMVAHLNTIEDREERTKKAEVIVNIMGQLNPQLKDVADLKHKLWDHLYIISDYTLDVDGPFPKPSREEKNTRPRPVTYPSNRIRYRFYGKNVELMIKEAAAMEDGPVKTLFINLMGTFMKSSCQNWNDENIADEAILNHITVLSQGKLKLDPSSEDINFVTRERPQHRNKNNGSHNKQRNRRQNKNNYKGNRNNRHKN